MSLLSGRVEVEVLRLSFGTMYLSWYDLFLNRDTCTCTKLISTRMCWGIALNCKLELLF